MIHKFFVMDRTKGVGHELYRSPKHTLNIDTDLLIGFLQALLMIGEEFGRSKGDLREVELGKYQISIMRQDHLVYVVIHDTYDSEPFTARIIQAVIDKYHPLFVDMNFNQEFQNEEELREDIGIMLQTMDFPMEEMQKVNNLVSRFLTETNWMTDTIFLTDLDAGIIKIFASSESEDDPIVIRLMEIMSEIPFERHWIGETKLFEKVKVGNSSKEYEAWFIYRVGLTEFCYMGRAYLSTYGERERLVQGLEELTQQTSNRIMSNSNSSV